MRVPILKHAGFRGKKITIYFLLIFFFQKISKLKKNVGPVIIKDMQTPPPFRSGGKFMKDAESAE